MHPSTLPQLTSDQMLMASHILQALEQGGMPMHAADYHELAVWTTKELRALGTPTLLALRQMAPPSLLSIIDNLLHERQESGGTLGGIDGLIAHCTYRGIMLRLGALRSS